MTPSLSTIDFDKQLQALSARVGTFEKGNKKINLKIVENTSETSAVANERIPKEEMVLKSFGNSWVEIEDMEGNILMTRLMRPGETYVVPNINGLTFNTGNAGALSLSQGDVIVPKLGEVGEIITARPLNIKTFSKKELINAFKQISKTPPPLEMREISASGKLFFNEASNLEAFGK